MIFLIASLSVYHRFGLMVLLSFEEHAPLLGCPTVPFTTGKLLFRLIMAKQDR